MTNSENLSAPVAIEARAMPVVFAATLPKAAASFSPEEKAASARSSAALMDSFEAGDSPFFALMLLGLMAFPFCTLRDLFWAKS